MISKIISQIFSELFLFYSLFPYFQKMPFEEEEIHVLREIINIIRLNTLKIFAIEVFLSLLAIQFLIKKSLPYTINDTLKKVL